MESQPQVQGTHGVLIEGLDYAYGEKVALQAVSLQLRRGVFTALLGPNGAGKSTLVALLSRLFVAEKGSIEIFGHDLRRQSRAALARMGIVFQQPTLDLDLTVRQNMVYFAALHGLSGRQARSRIEESLERLGLGERGTERARALNGGHRRRLEIARCLIHQPDFLLLDEPTVGLDVPTRSALVEHVHGLCKEKGLTVLWATHLVDEVWPDDDLIILHRARIRASGSVAEVLEDCGCDSVIDAFQHYTAAEREAA